MHLQLWNSARRRAEIKTTMDRDRHFADRVRRDGKTTEERLRAERR